MALPDAPGIATMRVARNGNGDGNVAINELVAGVSGALAGCRL